MVRINSIANLPTMKILFVLIVYLLMVISIGLLAGIMSR